MARFVYWASKEQILDHLYTIPKGGHGLLMSKVAVAECASEFEVKLVKEDGVTPAAGSATLVEELRQGTIVPIALVNVEHGNRVQVLHRITKNPWSTPLKIRFAADATAADAKARAASYATTPIVGATHLPQAMTAEVWVRLLNFTKRYEGGTDFLYNDKSRPRQLVTCGVGRMFATPDEAADNRLCFVNPSGETPSREEMKEDYAAASNLVRTESNLFDFALVTRLRLPWAKVDELLASFMAIKVNALVRRPEFANLASFPAAAQVACASIAYGSWSYGVLRPTLEAVQARDWKRAADVYRSPGWDPRKDDAHRQLFRDAGGG